MSGYEVNYIDHLTKSQNDGSEESDESDESKESECLNKFVCPITGENYDPRDFGRSISLIRDARPATVAEIDELKSMGYAFGSVTPTIHVADLYSLDAIYEWIIVNKKTHPISRKVFTQNEIDRIADRYTNRHIYNVNYDKLTLQSMLVDIIEHIKTKSLDTKSDQYRILKCHLKPQYLQNYVEISREDLVTSFITKEEGAPSWVVRPSKYKGFDYGKTSDGKLFEMTEYTACSSINMSKVIFHYLHEKIFSYGYYMCSGIYVDGVLDKQRKSPYTTYFDLLVSTLVIMESKGVNINLPKN